MKRVVPRVRGRRTRAWLIAVPLPILSLFSNDPSSGNDSQQALEKIRLLDASLSPHPFSPAAMDGRRDFLTLDARFGVRLTDALRALERSSPQSSETRFFVEWEWVILAPDGASEVVTLRRLEPILPPFEIERLPETGGGDLEFVRVRSRLAWNGLTGAGSHVPDGGYPFRIEARTVRVNTPGNSSAAETTSPKPVERVGVRRTGQGIVLDWEPVTQDVYNRPASVLRYHIYRDTRPDFVPDVQSHSNLVAAADGVSAIDPGADADPGPFFYRITAVDASGNESGIQAIRKTIDAIPPAVGQASLDNTPPAMTIDDPAPEALLPVGMVLVVAEYRDSGSGIDASSFSAALDGADVTPLFTTTDDSASALLAGLQDGPRCVVIAVRDVAGNESRASVCFTVDAAPPEIGALVAPPPNDNGWNNSDVTVSFDCHDETSGVASCPDPVLVAEEGVNQVVATATDLAGHTATASVTVHLDKTPPMLASFQPAFCPATLMDLRPTVRVCFGDAMSGISETGFRLFVDGAERTAETGIQSGCIQWTALQELTPGQHEAEVVVEDLASNEGRATSCFVLVPPITVHIDSPPDRLLTNATSVDVTGTVSDPATSVVVNGVAAFLDADRFTAPGVPLREGNNTLTAVARAPSGAVATASVTLIRDTTPPVVVIESPVPGQIVAATTVAVVGTVNDIVTGTVNQENCQVVVSGRAGTIAAVVSNRTFMIPEFPLVPGPNTLTAVAMDTAGNEGAPFGVSVTRLALTGQQIRIVSGNNQTGAIGDILGEPIVVQAVDAMGNPLAGRTLLVRVTRNNGRVSAGGAPDVEVSVVTDPAGLASVEWTLGTRVGAGNNRVEVTGVGFAAPVVFCASATAATCDKLLAIGGENQVGSVGEALARPLEVVAVDPGGNSCADLPVTFRVEQGGGSFGGLQEIMVPTNADGRAAAVLTLGPQPGVNNNVVSASFPGLATQGAAFSATGVFRGPEAATRFVGVVLDTENEPVPSAAVRIGNTDPPISGFTDAGGQFALSGVPVGSGLLFVDGSTTTRSGSWPNLEFQINVISGIDNSLGMPIFLPQLDDGNLRLVGGSQDVTLQMAGVEGFSLKVFANSATFPGGARTGLLGVTQVSNDQVPMPPSGGAAPPWVGTLQPAGVVLDPPAQLTVPNSLGLPAGQIVDMFSFDHDLQQFVSVGTGTVQPDGATIVSDRGSGIRKSGWFFDCPPPPPPNCTSSPGPCQRCVNGRLVPANEGLACDDRKACTSNTRCVSGQCVGTRIGSACGANTAATVRFMKNRRTTTGTSTAYPTSETIDSDLACVDDAADSWRYLVSQVTTNVNVEINVTPPSRTPNPVVGGNVTAANYCGMISILASYAPNGRVGAWHSTAATEAHENFHADTHWKSEAFDALWPAGEAALERLSIPCSQAPNAAAALGGLRPSANREWARIRSDIRTRWDANWRPDDGPNSRPYLAGQGVLNGIIQAIRAFAMAQGFPACPP